jgi:hypothetical protein
MRAHILVVINQEDEGATKWNAEEREFQVQEGQDILCFPSKAQTGL